MKITYISNADQRSQICDSLLRSLPKWFGIESAIIDYANDVKKMDTWLVEIENKPVGFISINKHNIYTAEVHVMGVIEEYHRHGIGFLMIQTAESELYKEGFKYLTVKTLSENRSDENYDKTRRFYLKMGFAPIEEFKTLWGERNPCLMLIKNVTSRQTSTKEMIVKESTQHSIHMSYSPVHYQEVRQDLIYEIIQKFSFATLISMTSDGPFVSHLPVVIDATKKTLLSHCARANPHWKYFKNESPVTVIFNGPHSYISPAWYKPDPDNVPTWNYIAVHIRGTARIIEESDESWNSMNKLVQHYESYYGTGWSLPSEPNETLKNDLYRGITVFEISMNHVEAKFKLSQKQNSHDRNSVIENLPVAAGENGKLLAEYMKRVMK